MIPMRLLKRTSLDALRRAIVLKQRLEAIARLERQKTKLLRNVAKNEKTIARLGGDKIETAKRERPRPKLSAEARKRIAEAQRKRWAKIKSEGPKAEAAK